MSEFNENIQQPREQDKVIALEGQSSKMKVKPRSLNNIRAEITKKVGLKDIVFTWISCYAASLKEKVEK